MGPDPRTARRNELVLARRNAATVGATAPQDRNPRRKATATLAAPLAVPAVVAVLALAAGAVCRNRLPILAVILAAVAVLVAVDVAAHKLLAAAHQKEAIFAALVAVGLAVAAATGPITAKLVAITLAVVAVATARVAAHPATRARRERERRAAERAAKLASLASAWPAAAKAISMDQLHLVGPLLDDEVGYTYRLRVPAGQTVSGLVNRVDELASALGLRRGTVTVEEDPDHSWLAEVHVREVLTEDMAADLADLAVDSIADPLPLGPYVDGVPFLLRLFVRHIGAFDLAMVGAKKYGKSSAMVRILKLLRRAKDIAWLIADGGDGKDFGLFAGSVFRYSQDPATVAEWVDTLNRISAGRGPKMAKRGWRIWRPSNDEPVYGLVFEETQTWATSPAGAAIKEGLETLMTKNRGTGISVIVLDQAASGRGMFGHVIRRLIGGKMQFRMNESSETVLERPVRPDMWHGAGPGAFVGETEDEERGIRAQVLWTSDEERPGIAAEMAEHNAFPEVEWEAAEQSRVRATAATESVSRPVPAVADDGALVGEIVADRPRPTMRAGIVLPVVLPDLPKGPEMRDADAEDLFREAMKAAGAQGLSRSELDRLTGWKKTKTMGTLVHPAMRAGLVEKVGDGPGTRYVWAAALTPA